VAFRDHGAAGKSMQAHAQVVCEKLVDFKMNSQGGLERPRFKQQTSAVDGR